MLTIRKLLICFIISLLSTVCLGQNYNIGTVAKWGVKDLYGAFTSNQNYGYLANDTLITILDISDARHIKQISQITIPVGAQRLIIHNNLLYVLNGEYDAFIDVSNPKNPILIKYSDKDWITDIKFVGSKAIVLSSYGLRIVDLNYNFGDKIIDSLNFMGGKHLPSLPILVRQK